MTRALFVLHNDAIRQRACEAIRSAPPETRVELKGQKRTLDQSSKMWAMCTDVSRQLMWNERELTADQWKRMFLDLLEREPDLVPSIDGAGFVNLNGSSSDLSVEEMSNMIEAIYAFGAREGVVWSDPKERAVA